MKATGLKSSQTEVDIIGMANCPAGLEDCRWILFNVRGMIFQAKIIYLEVDIGMTVRPADWRLEGEQLEEDCTQAQPMQCTSTNMHPTSQPTHNIICITEK